MTRLNGARCAVWGALATRSIALPLLRLEHANLNARRETGRTPRPGDPSVKPRSGTSRAPEWSMPAPGALLCLSMRPFDQERLIPSRENTLTVYYMKKSFERRSHAFLLFVLDEGRQISTNETLVSACSNEVNITYPQISSARLSRTK